jgi:hypothetical protein
MTMLAAARRAIAGARYARASVGARAAEAALAQAIEDIV